jgi:hypothetical protein
VPKYRSTFHAIVQIVRTEGIRTLYAGLAPNLLGSTVSWGSYFYCYNMLRGIARREQRFLDSAGQLGPAVNLGCATCSGFLTCLATNPIWLIKTRLQLQQGQLSSQAASQGIRCGLADANHIALPSLIPNGISWCEFAVCWPDPLTLRVFPTSPAWIGSHTRYKGFVDALLQVVKTEGLAGLYRGPASPHLACAMTPAFPHLRARSCWKSAVTRVWDGALAEVARVGATVPSVPRVRMTQPRPPFPSYAINSPPP